MNYSKDAERWAATTYGPRPPTQMKFVFRRAKPGERLADNRTFTWGYFLHPGKFPYIACQHDFSEDGTIFCEKQEGISTIFFNRNNLRYQIVRQTGYVNPHTPEDGSLGPYIEFGTCSRL